MRVLLVLLVRAPTLNLLLVLLRSLVLVDGIMCSACSGTQRRVTMSPCRAPSASGLLLLRLVLRWGGSGRIMMMSLWAMRVARVKARRVLA
jgi:hypothetical protein